MGKDQGEYWLQKNTAPKKKNSPCFGIRRQTNSHLEAKPTTKTGFRNFYSVQNFLTNFSQTPPKKFSLWWPLKRSHWHLCVFQKHMAFHSCATVLLKKKNRHRSFRVHFGFYAFGSLWTKHQVEIENDGLLEKQIKFLGILEKGFKLPPPFPEVQRFWASYATLEQEGVG